MGRLLLDPGAAEIPGGGDGIGVAGSPGEAQVDLSAPTTTAAEPVTTGLESTGTAQATAAPAQPVTPADPNAAAWSLRDVGTQDYGVEFPPHIDTDQKAMAWLAQQAAANRQADYYARIGQQLAPHAQKIGAYLKQQQSPPATPERQPWQAPQFDRRWESLLERDPATGVIVGKTAAVPAEVVRSANEFYEWKQSFDENPAAVIEKLVEARAASIVNQQLDQRFAEQQNVRDIEAVKQANASWFYATDAAGQPQFDHQGRPQVSPVGAIYLRNLASVRSMGVTGTRNQDQLAQQLTQGELSQSRAQQAAQAAAAGGLPARQASANPNVNPLGALAPQRGAITPGYTPATTEGLSLSENLRREFLAQGITDADIIGSLGS